VLGAEYCCAYIQSVVGSTIANGKNCYHKNSIEDSSGKLAIMGVSYTMRCA
jgi:hypothetical protein